MSVRFPLFARLFNGRKTFPARRQSRPRHSLRLSAAPYRLESRAMMSCDGLPDGDPCCMECEPGGGGDSPANTPPAVVGLDFVTWNEDDYSMPIDASQAFQDAEDWSDQLSYSIVDAGDPNLVGNVSLDPTGQIVIQGVANAFGFGSITIRCTDSGGQWADAVLTFEILAVNDPPAIESFSARFVDGAWELFGTVSDVDGDLAGTTILFGGELGTCFVSAEVQADGTFVARQASPQTIYGEITAQALDAGYMYSDVAWYYIPV
jgi:hypothetical protein